MLLNILFFILGANFGLIIYALILAGSKEDKIMEREVNREWRN